MKRYQAQINLGIKQLRLKHGLTQEKFADAIGVTVEAVRNLERNRHAPTAKTIDSICQAFNIRPMDLLFDEPSEDELKLKQAIFDKLNSSTLEELNMINELINVVRLNFIKNYLTKEDFAKQIDISIEALNNQQKNNNLPQHFFIKNKENIHTLKSNILNKLNTFTLEELCAINETIDALTKLFVLNSNHHAKP